MTENSFKQQFKKEARRFKLDADGCVRCYYMHEGTMCVYCPVTFMCLDRKHKHFPEDDWRLAARLLQLPPEFAQRVVKAADGEEDEPLFHEMRRQVA